MVFVCLPSDALSQHLQSYLHFSYLGRGVSLHGCSSKAHLLLLTLDKGYLLTAAPPDLEPGVAPLGPPAPVQQPLLGGGVAPLGRRSCAVAAWWFPRRPWARGSSSRPRFGMVLRSQSFAKRTHWSQQTPSSNNTREDSTHGHHQMANTKNRLIIFFAAKDGETL